MQDKLPLVGDSESSRLTNDVSLDGLSREDDESLLTSSTPPPSMRKSKSVDLGKLSRLTHFQNKCDGSKYDPTVASKFSHEASLGRFSTWHSSKNDLQRLKDMKELSDYSDVDCSKRASVNAPSTPTTTENVNVIMSFVGDRGKWTVGRLSMLMLLLFTFTDFALHVVHAQIQTLESPDYYDALSTEVIRPAFRYHSAKTEFKPRLGLGTAAISSVTDVLSPILPFTGGLDLRREDYWTNGWFGSFSSVVDQVRDAFGMGTTTTTGASFENVPRGGGAVAAQKKQTPTKSSSGPTHAFTLSAPSPFVPLEGIADMTLSELAIAFRFAMESTRDDFNQAKFFHGLLPRVKYVLGAMSEATSRSRGKGVLPAQTNGSDQAQTGNIDALQFCAAMRLFGEWRVLRQVPEGYKGFAVGMSLGQKDVVQNVAKIEQAAHHWIDNQLDMDDDNEEILELRSPTLRELMEYEIDVNVHDNSKLPRLKDKTAAMGLLWVRRQLQYQTALFANVIQVPAVFESTNAAVSAGYADVYGKYHGWAVQKIFNYSFQSAPEPSEIFKVMNPHRLKEVMASLEANGAGRISSNDCDKMNPLEKIGKHIGTEWDKLAGSVGSEWDKLADSVVRLFHGEAQQQGNPTHDVAFVEQREENMYVDVNQLVAEEMQKDAFQNIDSFLQVAKPLLADLAGVFDELNMDDPSKV